MIVILFVSHLQEAETYALENSLFFMETSAKTATNVKDIFYEIGESFLHSSNQFQNEYLAFDSFPFHFFFLTAKRLPRVQPTENPAGMVLPSGPAATAVSSSCCA